MISIKETPLKKNSLRGFVRFQTELYRGNDCFVPSLESDDINTLTPQKNPAFDVCSARCFMAYRDGKPVGRVAAILNRLTNEKNNERVMRFGFLDFVDDPEVSAALMKAVEDHARAEGMDKVVGPMGFTDLDHEGLLIEGFDELGTMATIYNYPYYPSHLESLGYKPEQDWVEYVMTVPEGIPDKFNRIAEIVKKKTGLRVKKFTSRKAIKEQYGHKLFHLINEAYADLYGYSPLTEKQIDYYVEQYISLLNLDLVTLIVDADDTLIGVGISMPSMSRALQKSHGRMLPFGWVHLLKGLKGKNDRVDLLLVAIRPDYQGKGANALLFQDLIPQYIKYGYKYAESNPELVTNSKVQGQWEYFENRQHRRRRAYSKQL